MKNTVTKERLAFEYGTLDFAFRNTVALLKLHPIIDSFVNTLVLLKVLLQKVPYLPPDIKSTV